MSRYESAGTWFEVNDPDKYPRVKKVTCPVCGRWSLVFETSGDRARAPRVMSYRETLDRPTRRIRAQIEASCLCGASFTVEVLR